MNILQIHRWQVQSQTASEQRKSFSIYQVIRNQKMKIGISISIFALFVVSFLMFCKRGRYMSPESEFQSDFESVILFSANKIVTYIVGFRMPTINVIILTCFLIPCGGLQCWHSLQSETAMGSRTPYYWLQGKHWWIGGQGSESGPYSPLSTSVVRKNTKIWADKTHSHRSGIMPANLFFLRF
jgi:predicted membrane protein